MILSSQNKVIFVHVPKTAGTSISSAIRPHLGYDVINGGKQTDWDYHTSVRAFEERVPFFDDYYRFTFVRNPWDRLFSWYCMLAKNRNQPITNEKFRKWLIRGCHSMSSAFPKGCGKMCAQKTPQIDYLVDSQGNNRMNFTGSFENIGRDFKTLCRKLGINNPNTVFLPSLRKVNHKSYRDAYNEETKKFVQQYHAPDIDEFKYTF